MAEAGRAGRCWGDWSWEQVCLFDVFLGGEREKRQREKESASLLYPGKGTPFLFKVLRNSSGYPFFLYEIS